MIKTLALVADLGFQPSVPVAVAMRAKMHGEPVVDAMSGDQSPGIS